MSNNFKNLGDGYSTLHPEKTLAIKVANYPILKDIQLTIKDGDDYFAWNGQAKGAKLETKPMALAKGIGVVLPPSESPDFKSTLQSLMQVKLALILPQRMFNARKSRALVLKTLKSSGMKVKDQAQADGIIAYMHRDDDKTELEKIVTANLNGTGNAVVVDKPNMF